MGGRGVRAQWAVMSKPPRTSQDYTVLDCSQGAAGKSRFEQLIRLVNPGTPQGRRDGHVDALPWATFSTPEASGDSSRWSAVAVREWSEEKDVSDRPILPTFYFAFPYEAGARLGLTYQGLYEAVRRCSLPLLEPEPVELHLALREYPSQLPDSHDARWFAGVAALLLEGPVVLTTAPPLSIAERLECLDAIAAFLPYGIRASLTACTWAEKAGYPIRLMFGEWAAPGQREVRWEGAPPSPAHEETTLYLRWVTSMLDRDPVKALRVLGELRQPLEFGSAHLRQVLQKLQDSKALAVVRRLADGVSAYELREAVRDPSFADLTQAQRTELLRLLAERAESEDLELLGEHWTIAAPLTLPVAARALAAGEHGPALGFLELAGRHGDRDGWQARLITMDSVPDQEVAVLLTEISHPTPITCRAVLARPEAVYHLIDRLVANRSTADLHTWIRSCGKPEFDGIGPAWLAAFVAVLGPQPQQPSERAVAGLCDWGDGDALVLLLAAAADAGRVELVLLSAQTRLLAVAYGPAGPARDRLERVLATVAHTTTEAGAVIDVFHVLLGVEPFFVREVERRSAPTYAAGFLQIWRNLTNPGDVARRVLAPLDQHHPLLDELTAEDAELAHLIDQLRITSHPAVAALLRAAENGAPPPQLAHLWTIALRSVGVFECEPFVERWPLAEDPRALHALLQWLNRETSRNGVLRDTEYRELVKKFLALPACRHYVEWCVHHLPREIDWMRAEQERLSWMLKVVTPQRPADPRQMRRVIRFLLGRRPESVREDS